VNHFNLTNGLEPPFTATDRLIVLRDLIQKELDERIS